MNFEAYGCPIRFGADVLGDRWCLMIIRDLMFKDRQYYRDFLDAGEGISTNILADRLLRLEEAAVITKTQDPRHGKRFIYRLTTKGIGLAPVMLEMMKWAADFDEKTEMPKSFIKNLRNNTQTVLEEINTRLLASD